MEKFSRRTFLTRSAGAIALGSTVRIAHAQRRPNVVLVMTDDQGYGDISSHGNPEFKTPNLDQLHDTSTRFENFHVSPTCSPTRAALMTGRDCNRTGVWHTIMGRSILRGDEITMADAFSDAGYATGQFGKWHLGDNYPYRPQDRGFQEAFYHGGGGVGQMPDYWGNNYNDDTYFREGVPEKRSGYCTDIWFDEAMGFIERHHAKPFFCYLPLNAAHGPFIAPEGAADPYRAMGIEEPRASFYGMIANIDWNMGRLMKKLDDLGVADDTILIFMTDNGTAAGMRKGKGFNSGMRGQKGSPYEGGHRVPFFMRWPNGNIKPNAITQPAMHCDLFPTLLDLCGISGAPHGAFDGVSHAHTLRTGAPFAPRSFVTDSQRVEHPQLWRQSCVVRDDYRLINGEQLFDLSKDPGQQNDITSQNRHIVDAMRSDYFSWWDSVSERFDEYVRIPIGTDAAPETLLRSHDWHGEQVPWNQPHIQSGAHGNGFWAVDIARDGRYRFEMRRWPRELGAGMRAAPDDMTPLDIKGARLSIGEENWETAVDPEAVFAEFTVDLRAGENRVQSFLDCDEHDRGAYYVYCTHV